MNDQIKKNIINALKEDHSDHDITTRCLVTENQLSTADIITREDCVICGLGVVTAVFRRLHRKMKTHYHFQDGDVVAKNKTIISLAGKTRALLTGERVALNFLSYLSGIATLTNNFVRQVKDLPVIIMDTRKTIPGMRAMVKMAVRAGGGVNHRFNLKEMVIIKDNHLLAYESDATVKDAILHIRRQTTKKIVIEVDTLSQFHEALLATPDIILLDNMTIPDMRKAVLQNKKINKGILLEASGGINLHNVRRVALTGVNRISIGALTHSPRAVDFSMEFGGNR
jgi:nicotinate-nucleotide pyrophosphorylase (carboxylating)